MPTYINMVYLSETDESQLLYVHYRKTSEINNVITW